MVAAVTAGFLTMTGVVVDAPTVSATTDAVTNCHASGPGSLSAVVAAAASGDTVTFSVACPPGAPATAGAAIALARDVTIAGPGPKTWALSGGGKTGLFTVSAGVTATISGLLIEDGGGNYDGGAIENRGGLTVSDSTVTGNAAGVGAGVSNLGGTLDITDTTLSEDNATDVGGGVFNDSSSTATIRDSTLIFNAATAGGAIDNEGAMAVDDSTISGDNASNGDGGGILNYGTLAVTASTVADSSAAEGGGLDNDGTAALAATIVGPSYGGNDCAGTVVDSGYNLDDDGSCGFSTTTGSVSDVNPDLAPVQNNGGPTLTQAPMAGSPALDRIPPGTNGNGTVLCPGTDQRGVARPQGSACDIGAVELVPGAPAITSPAAVTATVGSPLSFTVTTSGIPVPSLAEKGRLPPHIGFTDNGDGTATVSGIPRRRGVRHVTVTATFGTVIVTQSVTVTVVKA
ncbi:MAG: choice-of-anchor Q domain-containing protein [Acidimicrobiales bacterium]